MRYRFQVKEKAVPYRGYFRMERYVLRHELFGGGWSHQVTREMLERGHAVAVLPYDPELDCVVMVEQFRIGAIKSEARPWLLEVVAGIIEEGEDVETVARRETMEETGCPPQDLVYIADYIMSPGGSSERNHLFCARVDARGAHGTLRGCTDESEDIRVHVVGFEDAMAKLAGGAVKVATPLIALQWLALNRDSLRRRWARAGG